MSILQEEVADLTKKKRYHIEDEDEDEEGDQDKEEQNFDHLFDD